MRITSSILDAQPFLRGMTARQLDLLAEHSMFAEFKAGETILHEGDSANRFYLILEGQVELESRGVEGETVRIQTLGPGDVLGWSWLFPPYYWHFDARSVTPVKALFFYGTRLRELCAENHDFGYELMTRVSEIIIRRLQAARRQLVDHKSMAAGPAAAG
ncbi:MAG: cyclic nucleotide-binding domain-containing protein [Verrucomicrobiota bacterium]